MRAQRRQYPLQGVRVEQPAPETYDANVKPGAVHMTLQWKLWSRDASIMDKAIEYRVDDAAAYTHRALCQNAFEMFSAGALETAIAHVRKWVREEPPAVPFVPVAAVPILQDAPTMTDLQRVCAVRPPTLPKFPEMPETVR